MKEKMEKKILIVEDEQDIGHLLQFQVENMGYKTKLVFSGEGALALFNENKVYDLVIVDWMLPGLSGVEVAQFIRKKDSLKHTSILMLTAKSDTQDIIEGLNSGADDYVTKPFHPEVLKARIVALLRRNQPTDHYREKNEMKVGSLKVSLKAYKAYLDGEVLNLTPLEFKLLVTMLAFRGQVLTRSRLIKEVQGEGISVIGRTVDTHVFGLRKKLGTYSNVIETVRGVGYRIQDEIL